MSALLLTICLLPSAGRGAEDAAVLSAPGVLERAFAARYACTLSGWVEISTRKGSTEALGRTVQVASKLIEGRLHTYARFEAPNYLRGMAFLAIEGESVSASDERFVYLPSLRRIRRVGGGQSADSFLGTDLSYHDFERQHASRYGARFASSETIDPLLEPSGSAERGSTEAVWRIQATPHEVMDHARVDYRIARRDHAILGTAYYKRGADAPYKVMRMPRGAIKSRGHCRIPARIRVEDLQRRTSTDLQVRALDIDAVFDDALFTMTALETSRAIPGRRRR